MLLSGTGRTLENLSGRIQSGQLDAQIKIVVSSRPEAYGLQRAAKLAIPNHVVARKAYRSVAAHSTAVFEILRRYDVDLVCYTGWLSLLKIPDDYLGRTVNIHPSLLPSFGGRGMYGIHVHEAVLAAGCKVSGCTVHFADQTYDTGPIILQRSCPVQDNDTPENLAARVFEQECIAYPDAIDLIATGRVKIEAGRTRILTDRMDPPNR